MSWSTVSKVICKSMKTVICKSIWTGITWASLKTLGNVSFQNELFKMILSSLHRIPDTSLKSFVGSLFGPTLLPSIIVKLI